MPPKRKLSLGSSTSNAATSTAKSKKAKTSTLSFGKLQNESDGATTGKKKVMKGMSSFVSSFPIASTSTSSSSKQPTLNGFAKPSVPAKKITGKGKAKAEIIEIEDSDDEEDVFMPDEEDRDDEVEPMWTELYAPTSSTDLAPTKNRIEQVRNWLEESMSGIPAGMSLDSGIKMDEEKRNRLRKYRRILVLHGPAGVGKTTTIRVLTKELGIDVLEWNEGAEEWGMSGVSDREGLTSKLLSFLSRHKYNSLSLGADNSESETQTSASMASTSMGPPPIPKSKSKVSPPPRRLLLLSSLPNLSHMGTRQAFHAALSDYAQSYSSTSSPLVIVVSDTGQSGRAETSWMERVGGGDGDWDLRSVIGLELMSSPAVVTLDFLAMAPTFITKAIKRILPLSFPKSKGAAPSNEALQLIALSANGDLRSAINSLQFLAKSRSEALSKNAAGGAKKGKGSRGGKGGKVVANKDLKALLDAVSRREQGLGLFHALGKIFYNKRNGDSDPGTESQSGEDSDIMIIDSPLADLPEHLSAFSRRKYENDIEELLASVPVDTSTFTLWLHQNLPQYCTDITQMEAALDDICFAEAMRTDDDFWQRSPQAIAYAFHIVIRGVLMALPSPVPRLSQKTYKPEFFSKFKTTKESENALADITSWTTKDRIGTVKTNHHDNDAGSDKVPWGGQLSRGVLAVEMAPMLALMNRSGSCPYDFPPSISSLSLPPFLNTPPSSVKANEFSQGLQELTEKDDKLGAPDTTDLTTETEMAETVRTPITIDQEDEEAAQTWLEDDDIED